MQHRAPETTINTIATAPDHRILNDRFEFGKYDAVHEQLPHIEQFVRFLHVDDASK